MRVCWLYGGKIAAPYCTRSFINATVPYIVNNDHYYKKTHKPLVFFPVRIDFNDQTFGKKTYEKLFSVLFSESICKVFK